MDGPGIEKKNPGGASFSHTSRPALGPNHPPAQWVLGLSRGSGRGADHPPPPPAEGANEESYISTSPLGPCWPVIG
jgi:hypothetical protein